MKKAALRGTATVASKEGNVNLIEETVLQNFASSDGSVTINVKEFLKLVRHASAQDKADEPKPSPVSWQVVGLDVSAETAASCVGFTCNFVVRSFSQDWVKVPLLPASYAIDKFDISGPLSSSVGEAVEVSADDKEVADDDGRQPSIITSGGPSGDVSVLLPCAGDYKVSLSGLAPFDNERKSGFKLTVRPDVLRSSLSCIVHQPELDIKVDPALSTTTENLPANPPTAPSGSTRVTCLLGNFKSLSLQWTAKQPEEEEEQAATDLMADEPTPAAEEVKKEPLIVVNHTAIHTIGEGVVSSSLSLEYEIHHTTKAVFDILCPAASNIIDVSGSNIKRWRVLHGPTNPALPVADRADSALGSQDLDADVISISEGAGSQANGPAAPNALQLQPGQKAIRVMLHYPVQGRHAITVTSDLPMEGASCQVALPVFDAVGANRQKGYVGVEARTNVEVREVKKAGVARVDVSELPASMGRLGKSFLHAYKFLIPRYAVELDVKRHADAEVLTAVIEEAWLTATVSESGSTLSRALLAVRNTQRQFLRITLPERSSPDADAKREQGVSRANIWSAMVNGVAVKPAIDESGNTVLVPLIKASPGAADSNTLLYVELVFLEAVPTMGKSGRLPLSFARFDLPVQRLFVTAFLPANFEYGQFEGDLKEVVKHQKNPPTVRPGGGASALPRPPQRATRAPLQLQRRSRAAANQCEEIAQMCDEFDDLDSVSSGELGRRSSVIMNQAQATSNFLFDEEGEEPAAAGGALDRGVVPVAIKAMDEGAAFCFERLLVQNEAYTIAVPFTRKNVVVRKTGAKCVVM